MSQFEFVQVTVAIILGLGVTEILRNLGEQIRHRHVLNICPEQIMASALLLCVTLIYLWSFWSNEAVTWTIVLFAVQAASAISLALAAQLIRIDCASEQTPAEQYYSNSVATYIAWASAPGFAMLFILLSRTDLESVDYVRLMIIPLLLTLGFVHKPLLHRSVILFLLVTVVFGGLNQFSLD